MSTIEDQKNLPDSKMSDDAYDLLRSYYDGVDDVVEALAFLVAKNASSTDEKNPRVIRIKKEHVEEAGRMVIRKLQELELPSEVRAQLQAMQECSNICD